MISSDSDCTIDYQEHWNKAYENNPTEKLGWYEETSQKSLDLILKTGVSKDEAILNVGSGSSILIDDLVSLNYTNIIATDISKSALVVAKRRLAKNAYKVQFIHDDIINSTKLKSLKVAVWNDRALLHFFLKDKEKKAYVDLMKQVIKPKGYAIIATFAQNGAKKCCGLSLQRYSVNEIQELLGNSFELITTFNHTHINPFGEERPYIYTLFKYQYQ